MPTTAASAEAGHPSFGAGRGAGRGAPSNKFKPSDELAQPLLVSHDLCDLQFRDDYCTYNSQTLLSAYTTVE